MSEFMGCRAPWNFNGNKHGIIKDARNEMVSIAYPVNGNSKAENALLQANANLIAAAPELLVELEETHAALCFTKDYIGTERYKRNKAAIAKALGQSQ